MIEFGVWPKILRGSCLILRAVSPRASLWAVYLQVRPPNFLCGISQVYRFTRRVRSHRVAGSAARLHPERSKSLESLPPGQPEILQGVFRLLFENAPLGRQIGSADLRWLIQEKYGIR